MWSRIPAAVVVGWRITSQNEGLEPGVGDSTLPLCLSFPIVVKGGLIWSTQSCKGLGSSRTLLVSL